MGVLTDKTNVADITKSKGNGKSNGYDASIVDVQDFFDNVVLGYNKGAEDGLAADVNTARSIVPAGTGALRDFSYIAPEIPEFDSSMCVGCMTCVVECPDTAILAKVAEEKVLAEEIGQIENSKEADFMQAQFATTNKFHKVPAKKGKEPGYFGIFIDPTKCKGCAECVEV
jgi:Pyruvate/2-oxoacid:ferredoxin oxidoreductase delta subunit